MNEALKDLIAALKKAAWDRTPVHIAGSDFTPVEVSLIDAALKDLTSQMEITVKRTKVYGNEVVYPVCDTAICLTMLGDTKTLTPRQVNIIKALGYKIVLAEQEEI
jgi:hypothetical protein